MNNKVSVFGQRRAGVYLLSEIYNPDDVTSSVQNINKVIPAIGSLVVDDTVGNHNTLYVVYSVDAITHRSTLVNANILDTTDDTNLTYSYGNNNYKLFFTTRQPEKIYFKTNDTSPKPGKDYYLKNEDTSYSLVTSADIASTSFLANNVYYEAMYAYEAAVDSRLAIYNNDAVTFTVFRSVAFDKTDGTNDVVSWYYKLPVSETDNAGDYRYRETSDTERVDGKRYYVKSGDTYIYFTGAFEQGATYYEEALEISDNNIVHSCKIPLDTYTDTTISGPGEVVSRQAKCTRYFYTPFELIQGERYLLIVNDTQNRTVAQAVLEGQPMLALQELNEKYRLITKFDIWTDYDESIGYKCCVPRFSSLDSVQFYFNITYNDGVVDTLPGVDNVRLFAYGLEQVNTFAPVGSYYDVLFKYFVPSVEQVGLNENFDRNYEIGPTKRYIYKRVRIYISDGIQGPDNIPPEVTNMRANPPAITNTDVYVLADFIDNIEVRDRLYRIGDSGEWLAYPDNGVRVTTNGTTVYFKAIDTSDNESEIKSYTVTNIDKIPPVAPVLTKFPTELTTINDYVTCVAISISQAADAVSTEYTEAATINSSTVWTPVSNNRYTTTTNKPKITFRSKDAAGNVSELVETSVTNIDTVAPTIDVTHQVENNIATVTAVLKKNGSPINTSVYTNASLEYSFEGYEGWTTYDGPFTVSSNVTIIFRAQDGIYDGITGANGHKGNTATTTYAVTGIDNNVYTPVITASPTILTNGDVTATITYHEISAVKKYFATSDDNPVANTATIVWEDCESSSINFQTPYNCYVYALEGNGTETSEVVVYHIDNIDKIPPDIPTATSNPPQNQMTNGTVLVTPTYSDDTYVRYYSTNDAVMSNPNSMNYWSVYDPSTMDGIPVDTNNTHVYFRAKDQAGNISDICDFLVQNIRRYNLDAPTITPSTTAATRQDVTVTIVYDDRAVTKEYKIGDNGVWTAYTAPFPVSSNTIVYARCEDNATNTSSSNRTINNIDKAEPAISDIVLTPSKYTNGSVVVTATFHDSGSTGEGQEFIGLADEHGKQYKIGNASSWTDYTSGVTVTENTTVYLKATDKAGNTYEQEVYVNNIDKDAPIVTPDTPSSTWHTGSETIYATATDYPSGIASIEYKIGSGNWQTYTDSGVLVSTNGTQIGFKATDNAGNTSEPVYVTVDHIDNTAPNIQITASNIVSGHEQWTNQDVIITPTVTDDQSGVKNIYYRIKYDDENNYSACVPYKVGGNWVNPSGTIISTPAQIAMTKNGIIQFRAEDNVGNITPENSATFSHHVTKIDKTAPVINLSGNNTTPATSTTCQAVLANNETHTIYYKFSAENVAPSDYSTSNSNTDDWTVYSGTITVNDNGTYYFKSIDEAENIGINSRAYTNIVTSITPATITLSTTQPTNQNITATITYGNDVTTRKYYVDYNGTPGTFLTDTQLNALAASAWTTASNATVTETINKNCNIYAMSSNVSGTRYDKKAVTNIDKVLPVITTTASNVVGGQEQWTNQNVTITATFTDTNSGIATSHGKQYSLNGGTTWIDYTDGVTVTTNQTVKFKALDKAGNETIVDYTVTKIDKTPPATPTYTANPNSLTNTNVTVTPTWSGESGTVKEYSRDGSTWLTYTEPVVLTQNGHVYFRETDPAGNTSGVADCNVDYIDKTPPVKPTASADITTITNQNVTVTATFSNDSVVKEYSVDGGSTWQTYPVNGYTFTQNGTIEFRGRDAAGNYSDIETYTVDNIDKTPPDKPTAAADITTWTNQNVTVTATFSDDTVTKQYSRDGSTWSTYTTGLVFTDNGSVSFRGIDQAGNVSDIETYTVDNIDKIPPAKPTPARSPDTSTHGTVTVTATYSSDTITKQYSLNGTTWNTYPTAGVPVSTNNTTVYFRGIDRAGNTSEVAPCLVDNIVPPLTKPTFALNPSGNTLGPVDVTITYDPSATTKEYSLNGTTWIPYTTPVEVTTNNTTVYARCSDTIGGSASSQTTVTNITTTFGVNAYISSKTDEAAVITITTTRPATVKYRWVDEWGSSYPQGGGWEDIPNDTLGTTHTLEDNGIQATYYFLATDADNIEAESNSVYVQFFVEDDPEITD